MNDKTFIVTRSGGEHGMGHAVRMGHLGRALENIIMVTPDETGWDYFSGNNLPVNNMGILDGGKNLIVDVPITDNDFLGKYRPYFDNIIVIVGTGWSINPMTRKLADLIVYQGIGEPDREVLQASGGAVLYGLEWLILGKEYETRPEVKREDFVLYYCGGGIPEDYSVSIVQEMEKLGLRVAWANSNSFESLYEAQLKCAVQVSTFGMTTYEALALRTPAVSFSRSEDHAKTEASIYWIRSCGLYENTQPDYIAAVAKWIAQNGYSWMNNYPNELSKLDGKGTQRLADYILREL